MDPLKTKTKTVFIGVSGPSGSGKSTLSAQLASLLPGSQVINADTYYKKDLPHMISPLDGKDYPDWNHPTAIDADACRAELLRLAADDVPYIILDGAFIYCIDTLRDMLNYKVFVTAAIETRLYRRICRNIATKGQTPEFIGGYYLACVRYREAEYAVPSQKYADICIDNEYSLGDAAERIAHTIATHIKRV